MGLICFDSCVNELHHLRQAKVVRLAQKERHLALVVQRQVEIAAVAEKVQHVAEQFAELRSAGAAVALARTHHDR